MDTDACTAAEELEFEAIMSQARADARAFGISEGFKAYLEQFAPKERMQRILAMFADLEIELALCQRLLSIESGADEHGTQEIIEPIGKFAGIGAE